MTTALRWAIIIEEEVDISSLTKIRDTDLSHTISNHMINKDVRVSKITSNSHMARAKGIIRITTMMMGPNTINTNIKTVEECTVQHLNMNIT